jgi:hypothetical protein
MSRKLEPLQPAGSVEGVLPELVYLKIRVGATREMDTWVTERDGYWRLLVTAVRTSCCRGRLRFEHSVVEGSLSKHAPVEPLIVIFNRLLLSGDFSPQIFLYSLSRIKLFFK